MAEHIDVFPIINSSSPELLRASEHALYAGDENFIDDHPVRLRIGLNLSLVYPDVIDPLLMHAGKPTWIRGLERLAQSQVGRSENIPSGSALRDVVTTPSGRPNRGIWITINPDTISCQRTEGPIRKSCYYKFFKDDDIEFMRRNPTNEQITVFTTHTAAWNVGGSAEINGKDHQVSALFKAGKGGGLLRIINAQERLSRQDTNSA